MAYTVMIETDNADRKLLPFLTAKVSILGVRKDALLVPNTALPGFLSPSRWLKNTGPP